MYMKKCSNLLKPSYTTVGIDGYHIMRWRLVFEGYIPEIVHIAGTTNAVADVVSRLNIDPNCTI